MGSASKRERRALAAEAAVAVPLHMAVEATSDEEAGKIWWTLSAKEVELSHIPIVVGAFATPLFLKNLLVSICLLLT